MHESSWIHMREVLQQHLQPLWMTPLRVLDVGSMSVNRSYPRTYREHMSPHWIYRGCDLAPGKNVDLIQPGPYELPAADGEYDLVISGQCLEHVENPFRLVSAMARAVKSGGFMFLTAPWNQREHRYPIDCWRILPDGMRVLLRDAGIDCINAYMIQNDCWGIGTKPPATEGETPV